MFHTFTSAIERRKLKSFNVSCEQIRGKLISQLESKHLFLAHEAFQNETSITYTYISTDNEIMPTMKVWDSFSNIYAVTILKKTNNWSHFSSMRRFILWASSSNCYYHELSPEDCTSVWVTQWSNNCRPFAITMVTAVFNETLRKVINCSLPEEILGTRQMTSFWFCLNLLEHISHGVVSR